MKLLGKEKKSTVKTEWIVVAAANSLPDGEVDLGWSKWRGNSVRGQGGNAVESAGGESYPTTRRTRPAVPQITHGGGDLSLGRCGGAG
jgi:hypothetical protein